MLRCRSCDTLVVGGLMGHVCDDNVNHPKHYGGGDNPFETIKVIEHLGWDREFSLGNVLKYVMRAGKKGVEEELTDLKKARWYLDRHIKSIEKDRL